MKTKLRVASSLLVISVLASTSSIGCKRLATDALDHAAEAAFSEASDGGGDLRIGHLSDDFPKAAPIDPHATVMTSASVPDEHGGKGWVAAFETDELPAQVLAFYDSKMRRMRGDAGAAFANIAAQLTAQGLPTESSGLATKQSFDAEKTVMTTFEFGTQGMLILKTFQHQDGSSKSNEKKTYFTLIVVNTGRPQN